MKQVLYTLIFSIVVINSSRTAQEKEAMQIIDTQMVYLDETLEKYKLLPIDSLNHVYAVKLHADMDSMKKKLPGDFKMGSVEMNILSSYADYIKGLKKIIPLAEKTALGLFATKEQMVNLRKDISKGLIPADSVMYYVKKEMSSIQMMQADIIKVLELKEIGSNYRSIEQKSDSLLQSLSKKH